MKWLEKMLGGDESAERELVDRYSHSLIDIAKRQLPNRLQPRFDPEDVVQSVYRSFFRRLNAGEFCFDESHDVWRLLAVMTYHKVTNACKRHRRQRRDVSRDTSLHSTDSGNNDVHDREPAPEDLSVLTECLEALLSTLPDEHREIVIMRLNGFTVPEISAKIKLSRRTVYRALSKLRESAGRQLEPKS